MLPTIVDEMSGPVDRARRSRGPSGPPLGYNPPVRALLGSLLLLAMLNVACDRARITIVCLGDSITEGEGVERSKTFVALLAAGDPSWRTINQGRSGWSSSEYLARKDEVLPAVPADAGVVLLLLGANDIRVDDHAGDIAARVARQIDRLTDLVHERTPKAEIIVMTPTNIFADRLSTRLRTAGFGDQSSSSSERIGSALKDVARRKGYRIVDLYHVVSGDETIDGVHPSAAGHRRIADAILEVLRAALVSRQPLSSRATGMVPSSPRPSGRLQRA